MSSTTHHYFTNLMVDNDGEFSTIVKNYSIDLEGILFKPSSSVLNLEYFVNKQVEIIKKVMVGAIYDVIYDKSPIDALYTDMSLASEVFKSIGLSNVKLVIIAPTEVTEENYKFIANISQIVMIEEYLELEIIKCGSVRYNTLLNKELKIDV